MWDILDENNKKLKQMSAKVELPVVETVKDFKNWFYVVEYNGQRHRLKLFHFQRTQKEPKTVMCIAKKLPDGATKLSQDLVPLIAQRYKVGEVHKLTIRPGERPGQYDAVSSDDFRFHLINAKNKKFADRPTLECRIVSIDGMKVEVEEVEADGSQGEMNVAMITPEALLAMCAASGTDARVLRMVRRVFKSSPDFADSRRRLGEGRGDWFAGAVDVVGRRMPQWLAARLDVRGGVAHRVLLLNELKRAGIEILERSGLIAGDGESLVRMRERVAECLRLADEYMSALNKIKDNTIGAYSADLLSSLERTGYIYEAEHRLSVLTRAMSLDRELMAACVRKLFDVLAHRGLAAWRQEPLRTSIVRLLTDFASLNATAADRVMDLRLGENKAVVSDVVRALAMALLLADGADAPADRRVLLSRLFRYASLFHANLSSSLNSKAYSSLFGEALGGLPFAWSDMLASADVVSFRASQSPTPALSGETRRYEGGRGVVVSVCGGHIRVAPAAPRKGMRNVLPVGVPGWRDVEVRLGGRDYVRDVSSDTGNIHDLRLMWRDIEVSLFEESKDTPKPAQVVASRKPLVGEGDEVLIRITGAAGAKDASRNPLFRCVVVDEKLRGAGVVSPRDIVHYNVVDAQYEDFLDDDGRPLLLRATVREVDADGVCRFDMVEFVDTFISRYAREGETLLCRMTKAASWGSLLISRDGYSLRIPVDEDTPRLDNGDLVWVETKMVYGDGKVDAEFIEVDETGETLTDGEAFHNMVLAYSDGMVYEGGQDDDEDCPDEAVAGEGVRVMGRDELAELTSIVDRQSTLTDNRVQTFNLLAVARLLALTMDDAERAGEYQERMALIYMMDDYARNQWIDPEEFGRHSSRTLGMLDGYPDMQDQAARLFCLSQLGRTGQERKILEVAEMRQKTVTGDVARLVLAYNMADGHALTSARREIRNKINELLGVEVRDVSEREHMGEEGPLLEFKTSMVFPPDNNMRPDRLRQCLALLRVVCGMMNSRGGVLMVGVNDSGLAMGLDADFRDLAGTELYDEQKCRDLMSNLFTNTMRLHMPKEASLYADMRFETHGGRVVYIVETRPTPTVMEVDGVGYRRVGTSTHAMDDNERRNVAELKRRASAV